MTKIYAAFWLLIIIAVPLNGFMMSCFWNWFLVPMSGFNRIDLKQGMQLAIFLSFVFTSFSLIEHSSDFASVNDDWAFIRTMLKIGLVYPLIRLGIAWLCYSFIL